MSTRLAALSTRVDAMETATKMQFPERADTYSDAGIVQAYDEVDIWDCDSWRVVQKRIYPNSTHLLAEAVEHVQDPDAKPIRSEGHMPLYYRPSAADLGRFTLKQDFKSSPVSAPARG